MKLRPTRREAATSWAAAKYPKCKGVAEASPELLDQVAAAEASA